MSDMKQELAELRDSRNKLQKNINDLVSDLETQQEESKKDKDTIQQLLQTVTELQKNPQSSEEETGGGMQYDPAVLARCIALLKDQFTGGPLRRDEDVAALAGGYVRQAKILYQELVSQVREECKLDEEPAKQVIQESNI